MPVSSQLDEVVQALEQHENSLRIRKMLFCAARNKWENNRDVLLSLNLKHIIQELVDLNSTLDQLTVSLYEIVKHLNRKTAYSLVANTIVSHVGKLYDDDGGSTQIFAFKPQKKLTPVENVIPVKEVAKNIEIHENSTRIRKMLFCICQNRWVNDPEILFSIDLEQLLQETYQLHPTVDSLSLALHNIVDSLNRKAEYASIANEIIHLIRPIYDTGELSGNLLNSQGQPIDTEVRPKKTAPVDTPAVSSPPSESEVKSKQSDPPYEPFAVRLEVMKYSNPLRAKILAFSVLYHLFDYKGKDWVSLKTSELDDLLVQLYQTYEDLSELETRLCETANHLDDPQESLQAAGAIVQALKPLYEARAI
ncbi:hypothetical protein IQ249_15780 [Lusitaniella coriacea LEGE 07157]|uniref:Uncharacterized protein n=1 Tax=Lusitaniella coriacea LEGE 07157 TaxID=945747 RepID=A0A8J7E1C2_9CYAN|nr:hypothetical protein [Lusitaniella coriacea]MBE9117359.1 hypothetical protein [Lusitaniella coriacea LEGE 07157]